MAGAWAAILAVLLLFLAPTGSGAAPISASEWACEAQRCGIRSPFISVAEWAAFGKWRHRLTVHTATPSCRGKTMAASRRIRLLARFRSKVTLCGSPWSWRASQSCEDMTDKVIAGSQGPGGGRRGHFNTGACGRIFRWVGAAGLARSGRLLCLPWLH